MSDNWRHQWAEALRKATELSSNAMLIGHCLIFDHFNRKTGQCNPGHDCIAKARGWSEVTVRRAVRELEKAGWIAKENSTTHNKTANYVFLKHGSAVDLKPKTGLVTDRTGSPPKWKSAIKSVRVTDQIRPASYEMKNHETNHSARVCGKRSVPTTPFIIEQGSGAEAAWDRLLAEMGEPPLSAIAQRGTDGFKTGWMVPFSVPPDRDDKLQFQKAEKWIDAAVIARRQNQPTNGTSASN